MIKIMWLDEKEEGFVKVEGEIRIVIGVKGELVILYVLIDGKIGGYEEEEERKFL